MKLRPVRKSDCELVWQWANDPFVRAVSFNPKPIPWKEHVQWFDAILKDANCVFWIGETNEGVPFGQIRFQIDGAEAVVSVSLDKAFRGRGIGGSFILAGTQALFDRYEVARVFAYIKIGNTASEAAFSVANYVYVGRQEYCGNEAEKYCARKEWDRGESG